MLPLKTIKNGDVTTKICVEDVYKMSNRILNGVSECYNNINKIVNSLHKEYDDYEGELIIGRGISRPCKDDVFDEDIGHEIAFKKAKLNANLKRINIIIRCLNEYLKGLNSMEFDFAKIKKYIISDVEDIRKYNPDFCLNHEFFKNDYLLNDETQEETTKVTVQAETV